jgi:uncharacterized protein (DUF433 family)
MSSVDTEVFPRSCGTVFTVPEVSALLGLSERKVRNEIEHGLLPDASPPRLPFVAVVCLLAFVAFEVYLSLSPEGRRKLYDSIRNSLAGWRPDHEPDDIMLVDGAIRVQVKHFAHEALDRVEPFLSWKERRVVADPAILTGEPVFKGSRLSVRHIGGMPESELAAILEDYPYLNEADIRFARVFAKAYPRMGRPRESAKAAD